MNISTTAKRLLGAVAMLGIAAVASSAYASYTYTDDFEGYTPVPKTIVGENSLDGMIWSGDAGDLSSVVATNYTFTDAEYPITPGAHTQVLLLDTQGATLTNTPTALPADAIYYVDQMVYLVPSEEEPASVTTDTSVHTAVYLNSTSNLVVYTGGNDGTNNVFVTFTNEVLPETWMRLTVTLDFDTGDGFTQKRYMKFAINGVDLESDSGYASIGDEGAPNTGPWFFTANKNEKPTDVVASLAYQGTGMIDDVVVTDEDPFGTTGPQYYIASVLTGLGTASPSILETVNEGDAAEIIYTYTGGEDWGAITAFLENGVPVTDAIGKTVYTSSYASVMMSYTNDVTFGVAIAPAGTVAPTLWALSYGGDPDAANEDNDALDIDQEYLLETDPTVSNVFEIIEIGIDGANKPYLCYEAWGLPNGTLMVSNTADLVGAPWTNLVTGALVEDVPGTPGVIKWTGSADATTGDSMKITVTE